MRQRRDERGRDGELVRRVRAGDRDAFTTLIRAHQRMVGRVVARLLDDPRDREEVCQDVFLRVHRGLAGFRGDAPLAAWIVRIAHHTAINRLKQRRSDREVPLDGAGADGGALEHVATPESDAYESAAVAERRALVHRELRRLPPVQQTVLTLYHLEEMSVAEIAVALEVPEGTVKSHLFRARLRLKESLLTRYSVEELRP